MLESARYLHADHEGSIVAVANATGGNYAINSYDEYGNPVYSSGASTNTGRFQYTGQAWIPELNLYYYKARFYSPNLGRFMQTDPIGYKGGENLYAYVGDDPVDKVDPTGNYVCESINVEGCKAVDAAYRRAKEALDQKNLTADQRSQLQGSLKALGAPGEKNGVIIDFASQKEIAAASTSDAFAYTHPEKDGIHVTLPITFEKAFDAWKNDPASPVGRFGDKFSPENARGNALAHEGTHVHQFTHGMTLEGYKRNPNKYEVPAYRTGNLVDKAFHTVPAFPEP